MECEAFSEDSGRCWLHPGKRIVGVCSLCLNDRLGSVSRHPPQFSRHSTDFSSEEPARNQREGSLLSSDNDRAAGDCVGLSTSSRLTIKRSRSVSERKALSCSSYGFSSEENVATTSTAASATKKAFEKLFAACHSGAEFKLNSAKHKAAAAPTRGSKPKLHQTDLLLGNNTFIFNRKSSKYLFFKAKENQDAFALRDNENVKGTPGMNKFKDEQGLNSDPDLQNAQNIACLIQKDLHHNHPWYSLFFKADKRKEAWSTQDPHSGPHSTFPNDTPVGDPDAEPSIGLSRSKSVRASSLRLDTNMAPAEGLPRSRSVSCGGTHDPGLLAVRDGDRDIPTIKQVSPLMPNAVLDEPLDASTDVSSNSVEEAQKNISSFVVLDVSENKNSPTSVARWWHAQLSSPVQRSSTLKATQNHSLLDELQAEKITKASKSPNCKQKKLQIYPLLHSKGYSIINFSISPIRFRKRKCTNKVELK